MLWYAYENEGMNWHKLSAEKANEIIAINKRGKKAISLEEYIEEEQLSGNKIFNDVVGQDSLTRFDTPKRKRKNRRNKNRNKSRNQRKNA